MSARYMPHTGPAIRWASSRTRYPASGSATATRLHQRLAGWYLRGAMDVLELGLAGKVAIVTGGSEGLGRATAERFARSGSKVAMCARRKDVLEQAAESIRRATSGEVLAQPTDVTRPEDVEAFVRAVVGRFGGVDILVNNAGTSAAAGFEKVDDAAWQFDIDLKLMAAVRFCRLVIPIMKQRGGGRIVNVTTIRGKG